MSFIFHKFSCYSDAPFKEIEYGAKSIVPLNTTKWL